MKKIIVILVAVVVLLVAAFYLFNSYIYHEKQGTAWTPKDATYMIEGQPVTLVNGVSKVPAAPGSASTIDTTYFGNDAKGDLNGDGKEDTVFLLTQNTGGTGTFYYVVAALATDTVYQGTNAVLLGDRIAPQSTEIRDGTVIVNYAERKPDESMTAQPSVGVSKMLKVENGSLTVVQ